MWGSACGGQGCSRRRQAAACGVHQGELQLCAASQGAILPLALKPLQRPPSLLLQEIAILKQLSFDKNILQYYGAFQICHTPMLVSGCARHPSSGPMHSLCPRPAAASHLSAYPQHLSRPVQVLEYMAGQSAAADAD